MRPPKQNTGLKAGPFTGRKNSLPARTLNRSLSPPSQQGVQPSSSFPTISPLRSDPKTTDIFTEVSPLTVLVLEGDIPTHLSIKRSSHRADDDGGRDVKKRRRGKKCTDDNRMCVLHVHFLLLINFDMAWSQMDPPKTTKNISVSDDSSKISNILWRELLTSSV